MKGKRMAALLLSGALTISMLTGCGLDQNAAVATLNGEEITVGVANFAARLEQAGSDDFYVAYYGEDVWSADMFGSGSTLEDSVKERIIETIQDLYTIKLHADEYGAALTEEEKTAIQNTSSSFMEANTDKALKAMGATQEIVEEYLELLTIRNKVRAAVMDGADTEVSDEEANTGTYSYVRIDRNNYTDENGKQAEYTEEQKEGLAETVSDFYKEVKDDTLEAAAESYNYTVNTGTFSPDSTSPGEEVLEALRSVKKDGELTDLIETEDSYYILRVDKVTDKEETEKHRETIIEKRRNDLYTETLSGWKEKTEWVLNEKVWAKVKFDNLFTSVLPESETESGNGTETESEAGTEESSETESEAGTERTEK